MREHDELSFPEERLFGPDPRQRDVALYLFQHVAHLPILSPHGHVKPHLFSDPCASFGSPADLFITSDHYVFRMLYSQGVSMENLGIPHSPFQGDRTGMREVSGIPEVKTDPRKIWQCFAEYFYLFRGTPTGYWLTYELYYVFGIHNKLNGRTAQAIYDQVAEKLAQPEFRPWALCARFNIEVLCTTDSAADPLLDHAAVFAAGNQRRILPTFRPDELLDLQRPGWLECLGELERACSMSVGSFPAFLRALEDRRAFFKRMGAVATDHGALTPYTKELSPAEAEAIFQRALHGQSTPQDAARFMAHMLMEMAGMSVEDGLVMQLHTGSLRNHNTPLYERFGRDRGHDIPIQGEFTRNLQPLLVKYGNDSRLRLILFTLDETTYARELAPLAGHYPCLRLGPPWWFHDSFNGMQRYFEQVMETAGLYNTAGFNDDTRAFASIPARHDLWRRAACNWVAGLTVRHIVDLDDAEAMVEELAYGLAKRAYNL
jgi:glucuronate isomerase